MLAATAAGIAWTVEGVLRPRPFANRAFSSSVRSYWRTAPSKLSLSDALNRASLDAR